MVPILCHQRTKAVRSWFINPSAPFSITRPRYQHRMSATWRPHTWNPWGQRRRRSKRFFRALLVTKRSKVPSRFYVGYCDVKHSTHCLVDHTIENLKREHEHHCVRDMLAHFRFSLTKYLFIYSLQNLKICPRHSFPLRFPLANNQQLDSIQNSFHLLPHRLWHSFSIPLWVASISTLFSLSSLIRGYSGLPRFEDGQEVRGEETPSIHWTCDLELSSTLCRVFLFALFF